MMLPRSMTGAGGPCPSERWSRPSRPTRRSSGEYSSDCHGDSSVGPDDLLRLEDFNDAELLRGLWARYERREIYTWVGSVLVSVNPYSDVGAFKEEILARYASSRPPQAPHLFAAVRAALSAPGSRHALLITGESGAGKTEATRAVLQFLAMRHTATDYIRDRLLRSTPVLEAFGNAHTRQNANSSRFGKFIEVHLANDSEVIGATLQPYMLEASRVAGDLPAGERTYHVFYILRAALSALSRGDVPKTSFWQRLSVAPEWGDMISSAGELLKRSSRLDQGPKEARCLEWFEGLVEGLLATGMRNLEVAECMRIVAAVALLSDAELGDSALKSSALLLRIEENQVRSFLTRVEMAAGNERVYRARTEREATTLRASVAQELYAALFSWLTRLVARGIAPRKAEGGRMLGLLDLYGFEVFPSNGFEQFLINYCNERLQQFFNRQVFTCEAEEYSAEGLDSDGQWKRLMSACQLPALALLEGQPGASAGGLGIFGTINDRSRCNFEESLNGGSNASNATGAALAETLDKSYAGHPAFCRASGRDCSRLFGVKHFAGEVYYEAAQFVRKNASAHRPDIVHFLRENGGSFLREVVAGAATEETTATAATASGRRGRKLFGRTLISVFQQELNELCTTLEARQCRHIRCLRPNDEQKPLVFDDASMMRQCRYSGLLEATRIRKQGFANRRPLRAFATRFAMLLRSQKERVIARKVESDAAASSACKDLREVALKGGIDVDDIRVGLTKVFLRESALTWFETLRQHVAVTIATAALRGHCERQQYLRLRWANIRIQAFMRGCLARVQTAELRQRLLAARLRAEAEAVAQALALRRAEAALQVQTMWRQRCAWKQLASLCQERDHREQMFIESQQPAVHELPRPRLRPQEEQFHKTPGQQRPLELPEPVMVVCTSPSPSRSSDEDVHKAMISPDNSSRWSGSTRQSEVPSATAGIRFGQVTMSSVPSSVVCRSRPLEPHELRTSIRAPVTAVTSPRGSGLREQCLQECWQLITKLQSLPVDSSPAAAADLAEVNEILSRRSARATQEDLAAIRDRLSQLKLAVDAPLQTPGTSVVLQRHPSYNSYSSSVVVPSVTAPRSDMQRSLSAFSVVRAQSPRSSLRPGVIVTPLGGARSLSAGRFMGVPPPATGGFLSARVHPQSRPSSYVPPASVVQASVVTPSAPNWVWNAPPSSNVTATPIVAMPLVTKSQQASSIVASLPTPSRSTAATRSKALTARAQSPPATLQVSRPTSYVPAVVLNRAPGSPLPAQLSARSLQPSSQASQWTQTRSTLGSSKSSIPLRKHRLQLGSPGPGRERSPARILFT